MATEEELLRFHTMDYVRRIRELSDDRGGNAGEGTEFGSGSYEIAKLAAGGAMVAIDAVMDGRVDNAYALVRPPGHHAVAALGPARACCLFTPLAKLQQRSCVG